jgi:hypothetical protein
MIISEEFTKEDLQQENAKLREALEIYAAEDVWWQENLNDWTWNLQCKPWEHARIALGMMEKPNEQPSR